MAVLHEQAPWQLLSLKAKPSLAAWTWAWALLVQVANGPLFSLRFRVSRICLGPLTVCSLRGRLATYNSMISSSVLLRLCQCLQLRLIELGTGKVYHPPGPPQSRRDCQARRRLARGQPPVTVDSAKCNWCPQRVTGSRYCQMLDFTHLENRLESWHPGRKSYQVRSRACLYANIKIECTWYVRVQHFRTGMYWVCTLRNLSAKVCTSMYLPGTGQFFLVWCSHPMIKWYSIHFIST